MAVRRLRLGIAGSGFGRAVLLPVFASLPGVEVVAVTGTAPLPSEYSAPRLYANWRGLIDSTSLDAVALALPPLVQQHAALLAANRRLHLFCEKPLALVDETAREIAERCAAAHLTGTVDFEFRHLPWFGQLHALRDRVGVVGHLSIQWSLAVRRSAAPASSWKRRRDMGGGAMSAFGCHLVDLCSWLLGPLDVVDCTMRSEPVDADGLRADAAAERSFTLHLRHPEGRAASVFVDTAASTPSGLEVRLVGSDGTLMIRDDDPDNYFSGFSLLFQPGGGDWTVVRVFPSEDSAVSRMRAVTAVAAEFVAGIGGGCQLAWGLEAGVENTRLLAAARNIAWAK